jgi:hypothetical protein
VNWIKGKWQLAGLLTLVAAAIAVPAWASSGGDAQRASDAAASGSSVAPAPDSSGQDPLPITPVDRDQLDDAVQCMTNHGFGTATEDGGVFISGSETETDAFRYAADECGLPPRPTDLPPRPTDAEMNAAMKCMEDHGFGTPTPDGGVFISRSETDTDAFGQAADQCGLPQPQAP